MPVEYGIFNVRGGFTIAKRCKPLELQDLDQAMCSKQQSQQGQKPGM